LDAPDDEATISDPAVWEPLAYGGFDPPKARAPAPLLLLSRSQAYAYLTRVLAAEVTTRVRGIPQEVKLGPRDGMPKLCAAKLDNVHLVAARAIGPIITTLGRERVVEVKRALGHALFWPELMAL
jgi:mRNA interferase MazF